MSKTVTITREYDDDGKLTSETKTTRVVREAQEDGYWRPRWGFVLPPEIVAKGKE